MSRPGIAFGPVTFDPASGVLRKDGADLRLGQRAAALLQALIAAEGQPVPKSTLLEAAWPGMVVEEGNLTVQIAALRKALWVRPDGQDWIVTVPRLGYRLLRGDVAPAPDLPTLPVVAVMPFANLGGDPEQEYFADGVVEDIITALSRFKSFAVIARNSSFTYKGQSVDVRQVGHDLGVRYVLEGSIRRAGDRLRISAQLVECENGQHIWAEHFDGMIEDVFDFQDKITESVAMVVEPYIQQAEIEHSRRERPGSIAAYDLYLRALPKLFTESAKDNADAYALLTEALVLEPDNALVLALAALALMRPEVMVGPPIGPHDKQTCVELVRRGLEHAAGDATVIAHCSLALLHHAKDYDLAMAAIQSAAEANPNSLVVVSRAGIAHLHCGSIDDALAFFHRAIRLSPRDPAAHVSLTGIAHVQMVLGNYSEALAWATRSQVLNPNYACNLWMLISANAHLGHMGEAHRFLQVLTGIAPTVTIASIWAGQPQKDVSRCAAILAGLRLAGMAEG